MISFKLIKRIILVFLVFTSLKSFSYHFNLGNEDFFGVKTVVIDAGHGGTDPGCHGAIANEKDVCLSISLKLGKYIEENFKDVTVIYTRKTDVFIPLYERAKIANKAKADLFICVHANANDNKAAFGSETYVLGLHKSEANLKVAQRENSSIFLEDDYKTTYEDFDPNSPESYITMTLMQSAYLEQSLLFASKVQTQFTERVGRKNRGVKQAGYLVLHQTSMPSVLIETGFLTNVEEEKFLNSEIGQDYMASAIFRAFKEYKSELEVKSEQPKPKLAPQENEAKVEESVIKKEDKKKDKKDKKNEAVEEGVVFKVQIATSSVKTDLKPENFKGVEGVGLYEAGGLYRYTVGNEKSMGAANILQLQLRNKGFEDAFIVAFKDGKRIPISEAIKLQ
ncbi:MAG: N-acetylmuramoyl-L-alanine amidase [Flavobacteriales bacterium]|nr:N-acetylmuramoyl-L-alanine amidase [Flavobacteriales bacterium]MCB9365028.1 N-acetylmuramoyl-L-alanine amidase [Flavobacteriales bacterium]